MDMKKASTLLLFLLFAVTSYVPVEAQNAPPTPMGGTVSKGSNTKAQESPRQVEKWDILDNNSTFYYTHSEPQFEVNVYTDGETITGQTSYASTYNTTFNDGLSEKGRVDLSLRRNRLATVLGSDDSSFLSIILHNLPSAPIGSKKNKITFLISTPYKKEFVEWKRPYGVTNGTTLGIHIQNIKKKHIEDLNVDNADVYFVIPSRTGGDDTLVRIPQTVIQSWLQVLSTDMKALRAQYK